MSYLDWEDGKIRWRHGSLVVAPACPHRALVAHANRSSLRVRALAPLCRRQQPGTMLLLLQTLKMSCLHFCGKAVYRLRSIRTSHLPVTPSTPLKSRLRPERIPANPNGSAFRFRDEETSLGYLVSFYLVGTSAVQKVPAPSDVRTFNGGLLDPVWCNSGPPPSNVR